MANEAKNLKVVILAAGKGRRLNSEEAQMPKHMRLVAGKPILDYVLKSVDFVPKEEIFIIVGFMKEMITNAYSDHMFVNQGTEYGYGTGAAVRYAREAIGEFEGDILVLMGDTPLVSRETLFGLYQHHRESGNDCKIGRAHV